MSDAEFISFIWEFYEKNRRTFPWRETSDLYEILVSELMLQQTQTHRVLPKYQNWLLQFPTAKVLAEAPLSDVLLAWSGLGYNRRAKFLQQTAKQLVIINFQLSIASDKRLPVHNSQFSIPNDKELPLDEKELRKLPGVGEYTANAVLAFAFNEPTIVVETNIRTVIIHHFFKDNSSVTDNDIKQVIARLVPQEVASSKHKGPKDWYYALMDYGNFLKGEGFDYFHKQKGYTKQKPFKGSERFVRGFLLREVLTKESIKIKTVLLAGYSSETIAKVAKDLISEGLATSSKRGFLSKI